MIYVIYWDKDIFFQLETVTETDKKDLENDHTNLKVIQGHVTEIDSKKREITLKTGNRIQYHYVLLCHGARPKLVSNDKYIFGIRDTESVQKFQDNLKAKTNDHS